MKSNRFIAWSIISVFDGAVLVLGILTIGLPISTVPIAMTGAFAVIGTGAGFVCEALDWFMDRDIRFYAYKRQQAQRIFNLEKENAALRHQILADEPDPDRREALRRSLET